MQKKVSIVGFGNVGRALVAYFHNSGISVQHIFLRDGAEVPKGFDFSFRYLSEVKDNSDVDLIIVCVGDRQINEVIEQLPSEITVAYTSGSIGLKDLQRKENIGVFYPLQTFSGNPVQDMRTVPILLESNSDEVLLCLRAFGEKLFDRVETADSDTRGELHIAAVFVNNFTNHLYYLAEEYTRKEGIDFQLLLPLIKETAAKLNHTSPYDAQTGPARRGDDIVLSKHISRLEGIQKELYELFSTSIKKTYEKKL